MDVTTSLVLSSGAFTPTIDQQVMAWLKSKSERTNSEETKRTYTALMTQFRSALQAHGLDLDSDPKLLAILAEGWAGTPTRKTKLSPATFNQKIATLSSYYEYSIKHGFLKENPMKLIDRKPVEARDYAQPLDKEEVNVRLAKIDRRTLSGLRDYALLSLALTTGRRAFELAALQWGDFAFAGNKAIVTWKRCKGGKVKMDEVKTHTLQAILKYMRSVHKDIDALPEDTPLWISFARNETRGSAIGKSAISDICKKWLGTSKVHVTRHTCAWNLEEAGAKLSEIGHQLGHSNLATTSVYMQRMHSHENPFSEALEKMFGIGGE